MQIITAVVEKQNEFGQLKIESARLVDLWGGIAHTVTCREGNFCVNHCNLIIEVTELGKVFAIDEQNMLVRSETIGTLTTDGNSPKHNNRVAECEKLGNIGDIVTQGRSVYSKDGIAPSLIAGMSHGNTVPYVTEEKVIKIRQATEQGYALCEIGGGSGLGISNEPNKTRKSNRERKDLSNSDNGEYP